MKNILHKIKQHRFFLIFVFLFAYFQSIQTKIWVQKELNWYIFTPDAPAAKLLTTALLIAVISFFLKRQKQSETFSTKEALKIFASSLVVFLLCMKLLGFIIAFIFNTIERNFNSQTFLYTLFSDLMDGFIYGSFFLVYYYYRKNISQQEQLATYNQALSVSKINQLKAQLNPHFLFNNLNILDQLIDEDKNTASHFLNEFAEIYRYVLQVSDKHITTIKEEVAFTERYFHLIQHKYGKAYSLEVDVPFTDGNIVPLTLQLLLENAVIHNSGTAQNPVHIKISLNNGLTVTNNILPKSRKMPTAGRGLSNLHQQYALLSNQPIEIEKTATLFSVSVPIIP